MKTTAALFVVLCALPALSQQSAPPRAEVLVLGTFHMANPGHDIFSTKADDMLAPKRQGEIAQLIDVLKRFAPTKIAVERDALDTKVAKDYADYLAGTHQLTRNEIEQIGFRLAKELGHRTVYPVDADGEFPYPRLVKYAKATGRSAELDALSGEIGEMVKAQNEFLASHTVLETLVRVNSDARVSQELGFYFRQAELGEPYDWAGADLVADWFRRNMRIYTNVMQLASPGERILLIYGSGHLGWLRFEFGGNPRLRVRKLDEFVK